MHQVNIASFNICSKLSKNYRVKYEDLQSFSTRIQIKYIPIISSKNEIRRRIFIPDTKNSQARAIFALSCTTSTSVLISLHPSENVLKHSLQIFSVREDFTLEALGNDSPNDIKSSSCVVKKSCKMLYLYVD